MREPELVKASDIEMACKLVLTKQMEQEGSNFEYFLFDNSCVSMDLTDDGIYFEFDQDLDGPRIKYAFISYFEAHPAKDMTWSDGVLHLTYQDFVDHITALKQYLVDEDLTEDPFPYYMWRLIPVPTPTPNYVNLDVEAGNYEFTDILVDVDEDEWTERWALKDLKDMDLDLDLDSDLV